MKALVTFATEEIAELQEIGLPSLEEFSERHGYELIVYEPGESRRAPAWLKVEALRKTLDSHDEVLWVDADIVITDSSEDIPVPDGVWQALAVHHTQDGEVPNTGVWLCRKAMQETLMKLWGMVEYRNHPWWEQGALLELLGYDSWARPTVFKGQTMLSARTHFLSPDWNSHPWDEGENPRFRHATMHPDRAKVMREWASLV